MNDIVFAGSFSAGQPLPSAEAEAWALMYCVSGSGLFSWAGDEMTVPGGQIAVFPPEALSTLAVPENGAGILILMVSPTLPIKRPAVIQDDERRSIRAAFESAAYHFGADREQNAHLLAAYGALLVCYLATYQTEHPLPQVVADIRQDILRHFADPAYALDTYMKGLPFNYDYLRKLFQREMGMTPHQFLTDIRLKAAADTLLNTVGVPVSMSEICRLCGFREPLYFSRMFKKRYGVSPTFYARKKEKE